MRPLGGVKSMRRTDRGEAVTAWMMSLPAMLGLGLFVVLPLVMGFFWSLTDKRLISPNPAQFVGLRNYQDLIGLRLVALDVERTETGAVVRDAQGNATFPPLRPILRGDDQYRGYRELGAATLFDRRYVVVSRDPTFYRALWNTTLFVLVIVPFQGGLALLLAMLVNQRLRFITLFRAAYFSPVVTSMAVIAIVWTFLYNPEFGLINAFLNAITFGLVGRIDWLIDPQTALLAIIVLSAWQAAGFQMVIFLAGLQQIPDVLYEASHIDGANLWQQFRYVTWPQLRNTTIFVVIATTILAFRLFTQVDVMTKGGPLDSTITVVYHAVNEGFRQQRIGYASAITMVFFFIVMGIALTQRFLLRSEREVA